MNRITSLPYDIQECIWKNVFNESITLLQKHTSSLVYYYSIKDSKNNNIEIYQCGFVNSMPNNSMLFLNFGKALFIHLLKDTINSEGYRYNLDLLVSPHLVNSIVYDYDKFYNHFAHGLYDDFHYVSE